MKQSLFLSPKTFFRDRITALFVVSCSNFILHHREIICVIISNAIIPHESTKLMEQIIKEIYFLLERDSNTSIMIIIDRLKLMSTIVEDDNSKDFSFKGNQDT